MKDTRTPQTVLETKEYIKQAEACMDTGPRTDFIDYIARNPLGGDLIPNTGGARKIRWVKEGHQGKRGGVRIVYYYYNQDVPIFLFSVYAKNQKANLTDKECKILYAIIQDIKLLYEG